MVGEGERYIDSIGLSYVDGYRLITPEILRKLVEGLR